MSKTVHYNIEVKDSVVTTILSDKSGTYVSEISCDNNDSESVLKAIKKSICHAKENMKTHWPKYDDLYYTPHFANDNLVRARNWIDCTFDRNLKKNNLVFRTREEAAATAKKMLRAISPQEEDKNE